MNGTALNNPSRRIIGATLLFIDLADLAMAFANFHGATRFVGGLALGLLIPGWSIVGFFKMNDVALLFGLSLAVSAASLLIIAQFMLSMHWWHPIGLEELISAACAVSLAWQIRNARGSGVRRA